MSKEHFDATALLALPSIKQGDAPEQGLKRVDRPFLINSIRQNGVDVAVTRGAASIDDEQGVALGVTSPRFGSNNEITLEQWGDTELQEFGVVRNIVSPRNIDRFTSQLNPYELRIFGRNKFEVAESLLVPSGAYDRKSVLLQPESSLDIESLIASLPGDEVVAKPNSGMQSRGIVVGTKADVIAALREVEKPYLVEEKLNFSAALPGVRGYDEEQQRRLDRANAEGVNKELRVYYFGDSTWDGVVRVANKGETDLSNDDWLYIDLDSIPVELIDAGGKVVDSIKNRFGTDEVNIALDWVYASSASSPEPHWQVMEMNAGEPQPVSPTEHKETGSRHFIKLASQIARIAVK